MGGKQVVKLGQPKVLENDTGCLSHLKVVRYSDMKEQGSAVMRELIKEGGAFLVTADGQPVYVAMSEEEYLKREATPAIGNRLTQRINGKLWYSWD